MIKEDLTKGLLVSGTGKKYFFDVEKYISARNFICTKFSDLNEESASGLINYFLVTKWLDDKKFVSKRVVNARLNNIITLDYEWLEFFNN